MNEAVSDAMRVSWKEDSQGTQRAHPSPLFIVTRAGGGVVGGGMTLHGVRPVA